MDILIDVLSDAFTIKTLSIAILGFTIGVLGGVVPGVGAALVVTLLIPFTIGMEMHDALFLLLTAYAGASYGGSIPAILINTPGTPSSAAVTLDGYPMARQGKGTTAIAISAVASAGGSLLGGIFLIILLPVLTIVVSAFGSLEFLLMAVVGLVTIAHATEGSLRKGIVAGLLGALMATVGATTVSPAIRYTGGFLELQDGLQLIAVFIGVFAVAEMLRLSSEKAGQTAEHKSSGSRLEGIQLAWKSRVTIIRSSVMGILIGIVPGEGGTVSSFMAYVDAKRRSKEAHRFGHGHPDGVAAADASTNAVISGALVPTLTFGIPGNVTTGVLLGALLLHGVQPGANMVGEDISVTYTIIVAVLFGAILSFVIGISLAGSFGPVANVPKSILIPIVLAVSICSSYAINGSQFDALVAALFGAVGFLLIKYKYSLVAFIMGFLLGPLAETNMQRVISLAKGDIIGYTAGKPVALILIGIVLMILLSPLWKRIKESKSKSKSSVSAGALSGNAEDMTRSE